MNDDGTCPRCGADLDAPPSLTSSATDGTDVDEKAPWHFKLMVVALVV